MTEAYDQFARAKALPAVIGASFPKSVEEAQSWQPHIRYRALAPKVLAVANTRIECAWSAYCDAVPGERHSAEFQRVLSHGAKLDEQVARVLFPQFVDVEYAR